MRYSKTYILIAVISFISYNSILAQDKVNDNHSKKGQKLEYQEVESYEYNSNIIKLTFSQKKVTIPSIPKISVIHRKSENNKNPKEEIAFYDNKQNITYKKILEENSTVHMISEYGEYVVIRSFLKNVSGDDICQYDLLNSQGKYVWIKNQPKREWDHRYIISDVDGTAVEVADLAGFLVFYTPEGDMIKKINLCKTSEYNPSRRILYSMFSNDGNFFVVCATDANLEVFDSGSGIILFDKKGNEIWRFQADETQAYKKWLSPDNRYIMTFHRNRLESEGEKYTLYLLNMQNGQLIKRYPNKSNAGRIVFSSDGEYMLLKTMSHIELIDPKNGETLITYVPTYSGKSKKDGNKIYIKTTSYGMMYDMDISSKNKLIALINGDVRNGYKGYKNVEIIVFPFNDFLSWNYYFKDEVFDGHHPEIFISDDGMELTAKLGWTIKRFKMVQ